MRCWPRASPAGLCALQGYRRVYERAIPLLMRRAPWAQVWEMHALLAKGIASGEVQPLPHTFYARDHMQDALRYLASGAASLFLHMPSSFLLANILNMKGH